MVQSANLRELDDPAEFRRLYLSGVRRILAERKVRARSVVVTKVAAQDSSQMALTDDALDIRILPRRTRCDEKLLDPESVSIRPRDAR